MKDISLFEKRKDGKEGLRAQCTDCRESWYRPLLRRMGQRARESSHIIKDKDVNSALLKRLRIKQNGKCYWLGIDIDFDCKDVLRAPSIDRLYNSKGYTIENVVLTTRFANLGRCNASSNEMNAFISKFYTRSI